MKQRMITGFTMAFLLLGLLFQPYSVMVLVVAMAIACWSYMEFDSLFFKSKNFFRRFRVCALILFSMWILSYGIEYSWILVWMPVFVLGLRQVVAGNSDGKVEEAVEDLAYELMGFFYVLCLCGFLYPIYLTGMEGNYYLLLLFLAVFGADVFAFLVGRRWGKTPVASSISPKKSIEGLVGSVLGALFFCTIWLWVFPKPVPDSFKISILCFMPVISLLGLAGDLLESLLKRSRHKKDSGSSLPGHGGILDRIDSLALVAPLYYFYIQFILVRP